MRTASAIAIGAFMMAAALPAQVYDTAAVKPVSDPSSRPMDFRILPGGRLEISNQTLAVIVGQAFHLMYYQLTGGPSWFNTDRFDIVAKTDQNLSKEQATEALQKLLADRFSLRYRWEQREGKIFALTVGKNGPKLQPGTGQRSIVAIMRNTPPQLPGVNYTFDGRKATIAQLAERIEGQLGVPVHDETNLTGEYDFKLNFALDDSGPSMFSAVQDQLGLKLESGKGPVRTLVIERAEKPKEN
ncbi:MAG TPA: TIGR03435 family protein [Bryobacteraceae bacterium]|nr:TIGR03435 family protein [Bryobacteraceae bacterium]